MVDLRRVVRVREIVEPEADCVIRGVGIDKEAALLVKIKTAFWFLARPAGADDRENGTIVDGGAVDSGAARDDPKTRIRTCRVINHQGLVQGVGTGRQQQRAVGGESVRQGGRQVSAVAAGVDLAGIRSAAARLRGATKLGRITTAVIQSKDSIRAFLQVLTISSPL